MDYDALVSDEFDCNASLQVYRRTRCYCKIYESWGAMYIFPPRHCLLWIIILQLLLIIRSDLIEPDEGATDAPDQIEGR